MLIGDIQKDYRINDNESLVLMRIVDDSSAAESFCVAVAIHPPNAKVSFRSIEGTTKVDGPTLFNIRTMFGGRHVDRIIHPENTMTLDMKNFKMTGTK
jgi:hypothetical protein